MCKHFICSNSSNDYHLGHLVSPPVIKLTTIGTDTLIAGCKSKFGGTSIQEYVSKRISHPVFYSDLVYKLRRVKDTPNFISSGSKIVKRLRRRPYDPLIIERIIGLVLGPSTALYSHYALTNKAVGTI